MTTPIQFGLNATPQFTSWPEYLTLATEAEAMGLDSFWVFDHFVPGPHSPIGPCLECFTTISAVAQATKRMTLGTLVLGVTYRNPALVAKMGAMVDVISGGRFVLGMGAGWYGLEHEMYGIDFPKPAERVRREGEALEIITRMWTEDVADFQGRYYRVTGARLEPKPIQKPRPRILVGGRGEQLALRVTAKYADMWNGASSVREMARLNAVLDDRCAEIGRDPKEIERTAIVLHSFATDAATEQAKQAYLSELFRQPFDNMRDRVLTGSPEEVVDRLQQYVEAGFTHFMLSVFAPYDLAGLKLMADRIIPKFK